MLRKSPFQNRRPNMITDSNIIKLITLVWLMNILSAGYCNAENSELDCILAPPRAIKDTISMTAQKHIQGISSRKIRMVNKCPKGYENKDMIEKCENLINRNRPRETDLYVPVIDNTRNEAYWNTYCATCNNITDTATELSTFRTWSIFPTAFDTCGKLKDTILRSEVDDIYNLTRIFISEGVKLVAQRFNDTELECSMDVQWPLQLLSYVIPCLYEDIQKGQETRLWQCHYAEKTGRICTRMKLFTDGNEFRFANKSKEIYNETLSEYKGFTPGQYYVETEYPGVFYICDLPATIYGGKHSVKISIVIISLVFIIIYLGMNMNKQYLQKDNTNELLYFYMIGLVPITTILLSIYLSHPVPCVAFYLAQFLWAHHFFWSTLIFIEFCLLACCPLRNRLVGGLRYLVYWIFGFAIPLALPIIYYFGVLVLNENYKEDLFHPVSLPYENIVQYTCPAIPNHMSVYCSSDRKFGSEYYEKWLKIILSPSFYFFIPALFLFISVAVLYNFLNYRSDGTRSIPYRDHLMVLTKMAIIMGIHWLLFTIYQSYGSDYSVRILGVSLDTLCQLSIDLHGIIVFIAFVAEPCIGFIMNMCGCKYKSVPQQDGNDMEIS